MLRLHRSTGRTAWFMDSIADQLIGLFAGRASSPATPVTPWPSDSSCSRTKWAHFTLQTSLAMPGTPRCSDVASDAGDSSVLGHHQRHQGLLDARTSPATSGTPRCSDIASDAGDSSVLGHRPWWSDLATSHRCAIKLLHAVRIRVLPVSDQVVMYANVSIYAS